MPAYYNEIDPFAAEWLRNLIAAGHISPGEVDTRSIVDVRPDDLRGFTQCHFFAGIGGWSLALRLAGWPDDRPVWTGSCPCQPFSSAGKQGGSGDERHLWPAFFGLIRECRPVAVFGEQVASALGRAWLDHVCADLESAGYAAAAANLPACSVGAPHIRQRLWFVADSQRGTAERWGHDLVGTQGGAEGEAWQRQRVRVESGSGIAASGMADSKHEGRNRLSEWTATKQNCDEPRERLFVGDSAIGILGDAKHAGLQEQRGIAGISRGPSDAVARQAVERGNASTPWETLEWLPCRDGKARPTQPGLFPLAHGIPGRVGRLRAYGNAIVPQVAAEVIGAYMEVQHG